MSEGIENITPSEFLRVKVKPISHVDDTNECAVLYIPYRGWFVYEKDLFNGEHGQPSHALLTGDLESLLDICTDIDFSTLLDKG